MGAGVVRPLTTFLVCAAGCTSWEHLPESQPVPARGTLQVWSNGQVTLMRDPEAKGDFLVGRAWLPDSTPPMVPLSTIDSIRVQTTDAGKSIVVGSGVSIVLLLAYLQGLRGLE